MFQFIFVNITNISKTKQDTVMKYLFKNKATSGKVTYDNSKQESLLWYDRKLSTNFI